MISMQVEKRERKRKGDPGGYVETYSHEVRECFRAEGRRARGWETYGKCVHEEKKTELTRQYANSA